MVGPTDVAADALHACHMAFGSGFVSLLGAARSAATTANDNGNMTLVLAGGAGIDTERRANVLLGSGGSIKG